MPTENVTAPELDGDVPEGVGEVAARASPVAKGRLAASSRAVAALLIRRARVVRVCRIVVTTTSGKLPCGRDRGSL
jgi:hypothetical protein